jgi:hypothetical protein
MATRNTTFLIKRSNVPGKIPSGGDLQLGELGLNTADAILYTSGTTLGQILPIGHDRLSVTGGTITGDLSITGLTSGLTATFPTLSACTAFYVDNITACDTYIRLDSPISGSTFSGGTFYGDGSNLLGVEGEKVKVSTGDTTSDYLFNKLSAGTGVNLSIVNPGGNEKIGISTGLVIKSGIVGSGDFTGNPKKATITFSSNFATTAYTITVTGEDARSWTTESKTVSGFTINANSNPALAGDTSWQTINVGEN